MTAGLGNNHNRWQRGALASTFSAWTKPQLPPHAPLPLLLALPRCQASFGELALLYNKPRAATVMARTDGCLYRLHRSAFRSVVAAGGAPSATVRTLRSVEVLQCLSMTQLTRLAELMDEVRGTGGGFLQ